MIDRTARDLVIEAIDRFLNDQTDNFEFDEQISNIDSEDETVAYAVRALWFHCDDCTFHKAVLNKTEWDLIQRIKLLLMSDVEVSETSESRWSWDHALACVAFAAFVIVALVVGWGWQLLMVAIPFGLISIGISRYRDKNPVEYLPKDLALYPFESVSQIRTLRRRIAGFSKQRYRDAVGSRRIRSCPVEGILSIYSFILQILFGPVALLFQGISSPARESATLTRP